MITWRDNLKADRVRNHVAQSMFSDGLVTIEDFEASELVELAKASCGKQNCSLVDQVG